MLTFLVFLLVIGCIYGLLAHALNLAWGSVGMVNLGLAGFFAVGAYVSATATKWGGVPIPAALALAVFVAGATGLLVTFSTLRLRDDYLAIVTLGFAESVRIVAANEVWLTGGSDGIAGIPSPVPRDLGLMFHVLFLGLAGALLALIHVAVRRIDRSPYGRALRAIRDDQQVAAVAGKNVVRFKAEAFSLAAGIAGLAGALYGHYTTYVAPDMFQPLITIYIFLAVTAGGTGRPLGALIGAFGLVFFLEATRFLAEIFPGMSAVQVASIREMAVGGALILLLRFRPEGLFPERRTKAPQP
jgi:branched-chain amino acid transport system permease protein